MDQCYKCIEFPYHTLLAVCCFFGNVNSIVLVSFDYYHFLTTRV